MILAEDHSAARNAAARVAALQESWARLNTGEHPVEIELWNGTPEEPDTLLVRIALAHPPGTLDLEAHQIILTVPIEGQILASGTPTLGLVYDANTAPWSLLSVSDTAGEGELRLADLALIEGAFCRIVSGTFQG